MPVCVVRTQQPSVEPAVEGHVSSQNHMQRCGQDPNHVRTSGLRMTVQTTGFVRGVSSCCRDIHRSTFRQACAVPYKQAHKHAQSVRLNVKLYS